LGGEQALTAMALMFTLIFAVFLAAMAERGVSQLVSVWTSRAPYGSAGRV